MTTNTELHGAMPELLVVGYLHTLHFEGRFATAFEDEDSRPFGEEGPVTVEPLVRLSDARAAIEQAAVTEGWKLVLIEADEAMLCAGGRELTAGPPGDKYTAQALGIYNAMLAASPAPPKQQPALGRGEGGGVPLSDEQIDALWDKPLTMPQKLQRRFITRRVEAAHGIGKAAA